MSSNVSADLIWEISRELKSWRNFQSEQNADNERFCAGNTNSYLVKRTHGGAPQFSRDPLNLVNLNSRKVRRFGIFGAYGVRN
jgi:large subunit ribosomal protein L28e